MRLQFRHLAKIDSDFANWIEQCIQPAPEKRFTTAQEALSALPAIQHLPSTGKKTLPFVSNLYRYGIADI